MSDFPIQSRPALANVAFGHFGTRSDAPGITLTALPEGYVLHILGSAGATDHLATLTQAAAKLGGSAPRYTAPDQWFIVGDTLLTPSDIQQFAATIAGFAAVSDQSHGRVRIMVEGTKVETMLAKGIAANLAIKAFAPGTASTMICGHVTVHVTRLSQTAFELSVLRGFAEDLWHSLVEMALEYGVECQRT
jgi:sarcosine oxidase, subunit gamma